MKIKSLFLAFAFLVMICSCSDNSENEVGTWKLIERLADPGDGSGVFVEVDSKKNLIIKEDGSVSSNGDLCSMGIENDKTTTGSYDFSQKVMTVNGCNSSDFSLSVTLENDQLILSYPCIEPCRLKFERD